MKLCYSSHFQTGMNDIVAGVQQYQSPLVSNLRSQIEQMLKKHSEKKTLGHLQKEVMDVFDAAQLVWGCATHVPRLCSIPGFNSQPRSLCCLSLPRSYPVSCHTLQAVLSIKPETAKKIN